MTTPAERTEAMTEPTQAQIDDAMSNHVATSSNVFTSDGEGYRIRLMVVDLETLEKLRMPYTDTEHCDYGGNHASTLFRGLP